MFTLVAARGLGAVAVEVIDKPAARGSGRKRMGNVEVIGKKSGVGRPRPFLVGAARRAVRGGFGETALPVVTRFWCDKMSRL